MWKIPLFDLNYDFNEENAVKEVLASKWLTSGRKTQEFEELFSDYLGEKVFSTAVSSCTAALHLSLMALDLQKDDEVIISGLSFIACMNIVSLLGAKPVLADSKSYYDWNVSAEDIKKKISQKTKALILVHFAGYPFDVAEIKQIVKDHNLFLIEDVAHAVGAEYKGIKCGTFGDVSCFSFFSNKNLSTGEGGMIVTKSPELNKKFKMMRSHGMSSMTIDRHKRKTISYDIITPGLNYRTDEIRCALGIVQLKKLNKANQQRALLVAKYNKELFNNENIITPWIKNNDDKISSYHIYPIILSNSIDRIDIIEYLRDKGIQTSIHYPSVKSFTCYKNSVINNLPVANEISERVITLPLYPMMTFNDVITVTTAIKEYLNNRS